MTRVLGFGVCSLSLPEKSYRKLHHDKGWQKKEAEKHVEKKREKKNRKKPRRNPAKSVHVCVCGKEGGGAGESCCKKVLKSVQAVGSTILLAPAQGLFADISHVICTWCAAD